MTASTPRLEDLPLMLDRHADREVFLHGRAGSTRTTFGGIAQRVQAAARQAAALGLGAGSRVGLIAGNKLETLVIDMAALACRWTLVHLPDRAGTSGSSDPGGPLGVPLDALILEGEADADTRAWSLAGTVEGFRVYRANEADRAPADARLSRAPAIVFSSGTTGRSKAIIVDREAVLPHARRFFDMLEANAQDRFLIFLPLSNYQQKLLVYGCVLSGTGFCLSDMATVMPALRAYRPTLFLAPPVFYESACSLARVGDEQGRSARLAQLFGGAIRRAYSGMAPIKESVMSAYREAGVALFEAYGMTEFGPICANTPDASASGSVGRPIPPGSVKIAEDGEIIVSAPRCLTSGYVALADADEARKTYLDETSIATGDVGYIDDAGFVYIRGRKKELILTSQGYKIHPGSIERRFHEIAAVRHAVVLGNGRPYLGLLIIAEQEDPSVHDAVFDVVARLNREECAAHPIQRVQIRTHAFTPENGLLTANLKLNRKNIAAQYEQAVFS
ncbi:AMP-binding protein [Trinickia caryophylli]|uniref:Long-chain acyl-CoA synthetase (AMP-forming) n=1 Tax=Trinickia caryophylli TaxID=28094 RepID=A0A1X7GHP5_TRICW|nr:AMP-binding protein [Trinickia caryophylli]WQE14732.1 AMP-binding protein [Trinickia caryophylli]GLU34928.1 AMP-binding protein [Trinickia caryophylli]SMF69993.1 Long-chain acyl-CoA synthetase (AMP-forming) [Trinickia caryophylli]